MLRIEPYETLRAILQSHAYPVAGPDGAEKTIPLRLTREETCRARVLQPAGPEGFLHGLTVPPATGPQHLSVSFDEDTATAHLWKMRQRNQLEPGAKPETLVLNFASGLKPGGDVSIGGRGQEESLCMASTLLTSLESDAAKPFYEAQRAAAQSGCGLGSDGMLLSPMVEFFAADGVPLHRSRVAAVLSAVAPDGRAHGAQETLMRRIRLMLHAAAREGYRRLILGAWGCGRRGNDPEAVAQAFAAVLRQKVTVCRQNDTLAEARWQDCFDSVCFAVPGGAAAEAFRQHFSHFHREEVDQVKEKFLREIEERRRKWLPAIRGSLLGGAIGDALGYAVEFLSLGSIRQKYGEGGIRQYERSPRTGLAVISDDTQMTLFTAAGLLNYEADRFARDEDWGPEGYVFNAYRDWFVTQQAGVTSGAEWLKDGWKTATWIGREPRLFVRRAPGNTCLSALQYGEYGTPDDPINQSKGCGGVMRVAPAGLFHRGAQTRQQLMDLGWEAANMAALTHGHPLGYIPAAGLAMMVNRAAYGGCPCGDGLYGIVQECTELLNDMFEDRPGIERMTDLLQEAAELSRSGFPDAMCIARLGEGWVGEEALAIAVYCCLRYQEDFSGAVIAAVNHGGDSDSTGAVAGNLLGAWLGAQAIDPCWLDDLELLDVMEELAVDLCDGCRAELSIGYTDPDWMRKYVRNGIFGASGMGDDA